MQRLVTKVVVGQLPLDGVAEHVRQRLHEIDVASLELTRRPRVHREHSERAATPLDDHRHAAADAVLEQLRRRLEALLLLPVGDDQRLPRTERVAGQRLLATGHDLIVERLGSAVHRAEHEHIALGDQLHHGAEVDIQQLDRGHDGLLHQIGQAGAFERVLAEPRDRRLLRRAALELGLGLLLLGDVRHHPVPALDAGLIEDQQRVVAHPDDVPVAVQQPVLGRPDRRFTDDDPALLLDYVGAIVGVQAVGPQLGIVAPLLGRVAEDRLDLGADVAPGAVLAGIGGVEDRGYTVQQPALICLADP